MQGNEVLEVIIGVILFIEAVVDWKTKQISLWRLFVYGASAVLLAILANWDGIHLIGKNVLMMVFLGACPGLVMLLFGLLSQEAIGYGDGVVVVILGVLLGIKPIIMCLFIAFMIEFIAAMGILVWKKFCIGCVRNYRIAFLPFLFCGYVGGMCLWNFI